MAIFQHHIFCQIWQIFRYTYSLFLLFTDRKQQMLLFGHNGVCNMLHTKLISKLSSSGTWFRSFLRGVLRIFRKFSVNLRKFSELCDLHTLLLYTTPHLESRVTRGQSRSSEQIYLSLKVLTVFWSPTGCDPILWLKSFTEIIRCQQARSVTF